jgi:hypothetical protein
VNYLDGNGLVGYPPYPAGLPARKARGISPGITSRRAGEMGALLPHCCPGMTKPGLKGQQARD